MPASPPHPDRTIIEEKTYQQQLKTLKIAHKDLDLALEGVSLALSRRPDLFPSVPNTNTHRLRIHGFSRLPDLNIWFTFDEKEVHLCVIEEAEEA